MRVLTLIGGLGMGGAQQMAYELVKNVDHKEFEMPVLCYGGKRNNVLEDKMEQVSSVTYLEYAGHIGIQKMLKVMKHITYLHPDLVHVHMGGVAFAIPWGLIHHRPVVVTVHTKPEQAFSHKNEKLVKYGITKGIVRIVAVSEDNHRKVMQYFGLNAEQCIYINNGIDVGRFYREKHNGFAYINVARQDENKNQELLLKAFRRVHERQPKSKLYLLGDGPCHEHLLRMRKEFNLEECVEIPGNIDTPERYYAVSDAYVQTSHREAMPLSILEAMAAGLPIISTNVGGIKDVVDENGFLIDDNDEEALVISLNKILNASQEERMIMRNRSLQIVEDYSSKKMALKYANLYRDILNQMRKK